MIHFKVRYSQFSVICFFHIQNGFYVEEHFFHLRNSLWNSFETILKWKTTIIFQLHYKYPYWKIEYHSNKLYCFLEFRFKMTLEWNEIRIIHWFSYFLTRFQWNFSSTSKCTSLPPFGMTFRLTHLCVSFIRQKCQLQRSLKRAQRSTRLLYQIFVEAS